MQAQGYDCDWEQCRKKWENILSDYKAIFDYECKTKVALYSLLTQAEIQEFNLPNMDLDLYELVAPPAPDSTTTAMGIDANSDSDADGHRTLGSIGKKKKNATTSMVQAMTENLKLQQMQIDMKDRQFNEMLIVQHDVYLTMKEELQMKKEDNKQMQQCKRQEFNRCYSEESSSSSNENVHEMENEDEEDEDNDDSELRWQIEMLGDEVYTICEFGKIAQFDTKLKIEFIFKLLFMLYTRIMDTFITCSKSLQ
ncbi:hypothetical protein SELMODRAFT_415789 [Selaginella moellendorffii]|uniref:Uncharacterized protein n=1 Tax=Selaginella moellendorffii TaxID=88036 RepID=D8RX88_SELML|nr:hypothetical protein SELMODRAFT_415789 [Selaginella moellendorffii]